MAFTLMPIGKNEFKAIKVGKSRLFISYTIIFIGCLFLSFKEMKNISQKAT